LLLDILDVDLLNLAVELEWRALMVVQCYGIT